MVNAAGRYDATFKITTSTDMSELRACRHKYQTLRRNTFSLAEEEFLRATLLRIDITTIDEVALAVIGSDWTKHQRRAEFDWEHEILPVMRKSHPRGLDMAIWCQGTLCGVAVARLSDAKTWLSLTYLEGSPVPGRPLKKQVTPVVITAMEIYASQVQLHDEQKRLPIVRIMRPLPEVLANYGSIGYDVVHAEKAGGKRFEYLINN